MDPLEKKFREVLSDLTFNNQKILETELIHSIELQAKTVYIQLISAQEEQKTKNIQNQIASRLKKLAEVDEVKFSISADKDQAQTNLQKNNTPSANPQDTRLLQNFKSILVIASGKGGVGKSTVTLNLALALKKLGFSTSLFDADIYGPSMPLMLGMRNIKPKTTQGKIFPLEKYGIEFMSIGNLISESDSVVWRGPMVHQAVQQMLRDTAWTGGDFMLIDLPPGTGDVQLSLAQITSISGAIIVCTPQDLALMDARRAMVMFDKVDIPILGMVENMSTFICPECKKETAIFGKNGVKKEAANLNFEFLGSIPLDLQIREGGDKGLPIMSLSKENYLMKSYLDLAKNISTIVNKN